ncbi:MAG: transcriptional regulator [Candidatus Thermoplasmatota archaeon]|nr:transcriptional regulator [Candidatus Thermoplasmatota archaeon]MBU1941856.1 transcriptional regulator [Candidatus Thermoplasmatota archaeon]
MIEIVTGTIEEQIIKLLQKIYPITIDDLERQLKLSRLQIERALQKLATRCIIQYEPLPNTIYIRLLRSDFKFVGKKRQKKFIKHRSGKKPKDPGKYDGIMYS